MASRVRDEPEWLCVFFPFFFFRMSDIVRGKLNIGTSRSWHPEVQSVPRLQLGDPSSHKRLS